MNASARNRSAWRARLGAPLVTFALGCVGLLIYSIYTLETGQALPRSISFALGLLVILQTAVGPLRPRRRFLLSASALLVTLGPAVDGDSTFSAELVIAPSNTLTATTAPDGTLHHFPFALELTEPPEARVRLLDPGRIPIEIPAIAGRQGNFERYIVRILAVDRSGAVHLRIRHPGAPLILYAGFLGMILAGAWIMVNPEIEERNFELRPLEPQRAPVGREAGGSATTGSSTTGSSTKTSIR